MLLILMITMGSPILIWTGDLTAVTKRILTTMADGVLNTADAFPADKTETLDTDSDGIGNNADTDDDGDDGVVDTADAFPLDRASR